MPDIRIIKSQDRFMLAGGIFEMPLAELRDKGILPSEYIFQEFPKVLNLPLEDDTGPERFATLTVLSYEQERQVIEAFERAPEMGINVGEDWSGAFLLEQIALHAKTANDRTAAALARNPKAAAAAKVERLRAQLAAAEGDLEEQTQDIVPQPAKAARTRAPLPVVAPEPSA